MFLLPNAVLLFLFALLPILSNIFYFTTSGEQIAPVGRQFVGFGNFDALANCQSYLQLDGCKQQLFWNAISNTLVFVPVQVIIMLALSYLTALILNKRLRGIGFFQAIIIFPAFLSPVIVAIIWKWALEPNGIPFFFQFFANENSTPLGLANSAFNWSIFVSIWAHMGFYTLIFLAGLQTIPRELYRAAKIDRASAWRRFRKVTLPMLSPFIWVVIVFALIKSFQTFDEIFVLTRGGPESATMFIVQYIYENGFGSQAPNFGFASAASFLLALPLAILAFLLLKLKRKPANG